MAAQGASGDDVSRVVVIDDEDELRLSLEELLASWGMETVGFRTPDQFLAQCMPPFDCHVVLLDIYFPNGNGLNFMPDIRTRFPAAKIIMVTGSADKETAIRAIKLGAFDFIEKPFESQVLKHALTKAFDTRRKEDKVIRLLEELQENEKRLIEQNRRLEYLNEQLLMANKAMAVLARNLSMERDEAQRRIALQLRSIILPIVERMALDGRLRPKMQDLKDALNQMIADLASGEGMDGQIVGSLSQIELRVASLIRSGLTTEEIASQLNLSVSTVKTHRRNIRKKLGIDNLANLKDYLVKASADA